MGTIEGTTEILPSKEVQQVTAELAALSHPDDARQLARFFRTGPGEYGAGDCFIGVRVPAQRQVARRHVHAATLPDLAALLASPFHEHRMTALLILTEQFTRCRNPLVQEQLVAFYLAQRARVNNWDLVDLSAPKILGAYLVQVPAARMVLFQLAGLSPSPYAGSLWERRIAVVATWPLFRQGQYDEILALATFLLHDAHDLIHKATGWMLRELGKVHLPALTGFLDQHATVMPRTMLRYAVERLDAAQRQDYLARKEARKKLSCPLQ